MKPDWKKTGDYKRFNSQTKPKRWAWEFLRRNPEYQKAWDRELQDYRKTIAVYLSNPANKKKAKGMRLNADQNKQITVLTGKAIDEAEKWGLYALLNPDIDDFTKAESESNLISLWLKKVGLPVSMPGRVLPKPSYAPYAGIRSHVIKYKESEAVAVFDLTRPLQPQLKRISAKLLKRQQSFNVKDRRKHIDEWVRYLRLLDAVASGLNIHTVKCQDQIAKILLPAIENTDENDYEARHNLRHNYKAAVQLAKNPFKKFPIWEV